MSKKDDEMRSRLWALAMMEEANKKKSPVGILGGAAKGVGKFFGVILRGIALLFTTAIGLCAAVCKICFGFFFR